MAITQAAARKMLPDVARNDKRATAEVIRSLVDGDYDTLPAGVTATTAELNVLDGITATTAELNAIDGIGTTATIAVAASATTDGMDITITVKDAAGATVAAVHQLEFWMSEDAAGIGLTGDTYSGDLTASTGAILSAHTAKKHWSVATAATGIFVATLVDSGNPTDQYVAVKKPVGGSLVVSAASGTNWEGV